MYRCFEFVPLCSFVIHYSESLRREVRKQLFEFGKTILKSAIQSIPSGLAWARFADFKYPIKAAAVGACIGASSLALGACISHKDKLIEYGHLLELTVPVARVLFPNGNVQTQSSPNSSRDVEACLESQLYEIIGILLIFFSFLMVWTVNVTSERWD